MGEETTGNVAFIKSELWHVEENLVDLRTQQADLKFQLKNALREEIINSRLLSHCNWVSVVMQGILLCDKERAPEAIHDYLKLTQGNTSFSFGDLYEVVSRPDKFVFEPNMNDLDVAVEAGLPVHLILEQIEIKIDTLEYELRQYKSLKRMLSKYKLSLPEGIRKLLP